MHQFRQFYIIDHLTYSCVRPVFVCSRFLYISIDYVDDKKKSFNRTNRSCHFALIRKQNSTHTHTTHTTSLPFLVKTSSINSILFFSILTNSHHLEMFFGKCLRIKCNQSIHCHRLE